MESKDYSEMNTFMSKLTDEEYGKMADLMEQNGFKNKSDRSHVVL